jgi:hypothetical protein
MKTYDKPINTEQDVKAFFRHLVYDLKINFHPDDDLFLVSPTELTPTQSDHYNKLLDDCFAVCGDERIYDIANDIIKEEGGI